MTEGPWNPRVAVVIATHNRPELVRTALECVLAQDYPGPIEVCLVYDQSDPDMSLVRAPASSGAGRRAVLVTTNCARTPGLAGARNTGVLATTGELVAFCDDDDEWMPNKLRRQVAALDADPSALTCATGITVLFDGSETDRVPERDELTLADLTRTRVMAAHPSTILVRRVALLGPIGLVDEGIPGSFAEDYDWILRAAKAGGITIVREPLVRVRWGQSLFSRNWPVIIDALGYLLDKHPELRDDRRGRARILGQLAFANAACGRPRRALSTAASTVRASVLEPRAYLALAVALRLISAERVMRAAHRRGRGI